MSNYGKLLEEAIGLALKAHQGQKDHYGDPYILHPIRVMGTVRTPAEKIVAILHDVLEDTPYTMRDLEKLGFPKNLLEALDCVTKREGEEYEDFVKRSSSNPIARQVKFADLEDNMRVLRMDKINKKAVKRLEKYVKAWRYLADPATQAGSKPEKANARRPRKTT